MKHLCSGQTEVSVFVQITELSKEVFRLKEALGALSPPLGITTSSSSTHHGNPGQQMALQNRISILNQQLQVVRDLSLGEKDFFPYHHVNNTINCKNKTHNHLTFCDSFCRIGRKSTNRWWLYTVPIYCQLYRSVEYIQSKT